MLSPSASPQLCALPQPTHPLPYSPPPPPPPVNDPSSSVGYDLTSLSALLPLILLLCCFACTKIVGEQENQPQPQDIEQGITRDLPQVQQQQQQTPREVSGTVVTYTSRENIANCTDCAICLEDFKEEEQCRVLDGCKHIYHEACIDEWLTRDKHCPLCRGSVRRGVRSNNQNQVWTELQVQENMS